MLTNMGELVTRELERDWAEKQAASMTSKSVSLFSLRLGKHLFIFVGYQSFAQYSRPVPKEVL